MRPCTCGQQHRRSARIRTIVKDFWLQIQFGVQKGRPSDPYSLNPIPQIPLMRYFFKNSDEAVEMALQGLLSLTEVPLERVGDHLGVVYRGNVKRRVKLVVGGGSGHEPLFLGVAGQGMADGAVNGLIFAAPNPDSILAVIEAAGASDGTVLVYG